MYKILFYEDKNGNSEILEYIEKLQKNKTNKDSRIKSKKIASYLDLLQKNGLVLGEPYIKYLESDIWELRPIKDRILFGYLENNEFLILNYFVKKSQKTPRREIEKAKRLLKDYIERSNAK